ncbi:MAG TPA: zinc ribbon domain-containing protein [Tepidisphaeraceae bacterium]|nr:zinc ribbon domain-containing protein [Tepidisphaeraceae bacterium]
MRPSLLEPCARQPARTVLRGRGGRKITLLPGARSFKVVNERNTSVICSACGALSGPRGVNGLIVRSWICRDCGESHDRDVNAARNILIGSRCRTSVRRNESSPWPIAPSNAYRVREAAVEAVWATA